MPLKPEERKAIIGYLVMNCNCWKNPGDAELLNSLTDEKLAAMKVDAEHNQKAIAVANAAVQGYVADGQNAYRVNPETGQWETGKVPQQNAQKTGDQLMGQHGSTTADETYRDKQNAERIAGRGKQPAESSDSNNRNSTGRMPTADEWMRNAPAELQNRLNALSQLEQREKDKLISQMLANVQGTGEKQARYEQLNRYSLDELHNFHSLMPKSTSLDDISVATQNGKGKLRQSNQDPDILEAPTIDWTNSKSPSQSRTTVGNAPVQNITFDDDGQDETDWLRNAPASIKNKIQQAESLVEREKRSIIEQLVASIQDDDDATRLQQQLQNKGLDELRLMYSILPKTQQRASYFGTNTPAPVVNRQRNNDTDSDVLPLPSIDWSKDQRNQA